MTDIVEQLRAWHIPGDIVTGDVQLYLDAADEIERLHEEINDLHSDIDGYVIRTVPKLEAEIERLRGIINMADNGLERADCPACNDMARYATRLHNEKMEYVELATKQKAEIERLRAALEPFADAARDWAKAFLDAYEKADEGFLCEEVMTNWFANALMRGYDRSAADEKRLRAALTAILAPECSGYQGAAAIARAALADTNEADIAADGYAGLPTHEDVRGILATDKR